MIVLDDSSVDSSTALTIGRRPLASAMACANSVLPVPDSPSRRTGDVPPTAESSSAHRLHAGRREQFAKGRRGANVHAVRLGFAQAVSRPLSLFVLVENGSKNSCGRNEEFDLSLVDEPTAVTKVDVKTSPRRLPIRPNEERCGQRCNDAKPVEAGRRRLGGQWIPRDASAAADRLGHDGSAGLLALGRPKSLVLSTGVDDPKGSVRSRQNDEPAVGCRRSTMMSRQSSTTDSPSRA